MEIPPADSPPSVQPKPTSPAPLQPPPSTSHFPPPLKQIAPKSASEEEEKSKEEPMQANEIPSTTPKSASKEEEKSIEEPVQFEEIPSTPLKSASKEEEKLIEEPMQFEEITSTAKKDAIITEIESAISSMNGLTEAAEKAGQSCQEAIESHGILVEKILEKAVGDDIDADDGTWKDVFDAANKKSDQLERAQVNLNHHYINFWWGFSIGRFNYWWEGIF